MNPAMGNWIKPIREKRGFTQTQLGDLIGTSQAQIMRLEKSRRRLTVDWLRKLAAALEVPAADLHSDSPPPILQPQSEVTTQFRDERPSYATPPAQPLPQPNAIAAPRNDLFSAGDIPIYASAEGGDFGMTISYDPIERVPCPAPLVGVRGAFGFYVVGDSMAPLFQPGWMVLVHPTKPARVGDAVLVVLRNGSQDDSNHDALIKLYDGWKNDKLHLRQLNPARKINPIERSRVSSIHLVVATFFNR